MGIAAAPMMAHAADGTRPNQGACSNSGNSFLEGPEQWLVATWAGFASEGLTPEQAAEMFGFDTVDEFADFIVDGVFGENGVDANGDGLVCRSSNDPGGRPDYLFLVDDNKWNVKHG